MTVVLMVRVLDENRNGVEWYSQVTDMPFTPTIGMKIQGFNSCALWETENAGLLVPEIKDISHDIDEKIMFCLFEINEKLVSTSWNRIDENSYGFKHFRGVSQ